MAVAFRHEGGISTGDDQFVGLAASFRRRAGQTRHLADGRPAVCEVGDAGWFTDPMVGGRLPPSGQVGGRGLWIANQLCDWCKCDRQTPARSCACTPHRRLTMVPAPSTPRRGDRRGADDRR